jgi:hypothetical protein
MGPGAARALGGGREGCVEIAHPRGAYLRLDDDEYVHLAGPRGPFGPLTVATAGLLPAVEAGWHARIADGVLELGPQRVAISLAPARRAFVPPPPREGEPEVIRAAWRAAREVVPPSPTPLRLGIAKLAIGDLEGAVGLLAGRGEGLTPAGDDVLAGFAGRRAAAGRRVALSRLARRRSSPLGLAYLRCAERGELAEAAAALLRAIVAGEPAAAARRGRRLSTWGASSGCALFWGMEAAGQ